MVCMNVCIYHNNRHFGGNSQTACANTVCQGMFPHPALGRAIILPLLLWLHFRASSMNSAAHINSCSADDATHWLDDRLSKSQFSNHVHIFVMAVEIHSYVAWTNVTITGVICYRLSQDLPLLFGQNQVSNSWDIAYLEKCHHDSRHLLKIVLGIYLWSSVKIESDILDMHKCCQGKCCLGKCHHDSCSQEPMFKVWSKLSL